MPKVQITSDENGVFTVTIPCKACQKTGLYHGFAERHGEAVVCKECEGKGEKTIQFQLSDGILQRRDDITTVLVSRIRNGKLVEIPITYEQFLAGDLPPENTEE